MRYAYAPVTLHEHGVGWGFASAYTIWHEHKCSVKNMYSDNTSSAQHKSSKNAHCHLFLHKTDIGWSRMQNALQAKAHPFSRHVEACQHIGEPPGKLMIMMCATKVATTCLRSMWKRRIAMGASTSHCCLPCAKSKQQKGKWIETSSCGRLVPICTCRICCGWFMYTCADYQAEISWPCGGPRKTQTHTHTNGKKKSESAREQRRSSGVTNWSGFISGTDTVGILTYYWGPEVLQKREWRLPIKQA